MSEMFDFLDGNGSLTSCCIAVIEDVNRLERLSWEWPRSNNRWKSKVVICMKSDCIVFCL